MGYVIQYDSENNHKYPVHSDKHYGRMLRSAGILLAIIALFVAYMYRSTVRDWLIPGNPDITTSAFHELTADIRNGVPAGEAIVTFCQEILDHAAE